MKFLLLILITLVPGALLSETSEQYTYRAEFFFGDLNDGLNEYRKIINNS